ncbi:unnamed protein product [Bemisia tabaci]|uniref:alpha-glucosidase n=1 Tax=Bemisia tabaci TaxID=7038 RepID=A0A9P0A3B4_BEMTA|nr:unnamed protein product [Bemisia tabaci]
MSWAGTIQWMLIFKCFIFASIARDSNDKLPIRKLDWWEKALIYQIYPRSFKDSNGDGNGDLNGIIEKLDYVKEIGVQIVWIQPTYKSPMRDLGYDISDYRSVDPLFGTIDDFQRLIKEIHDRGMKIIMDFVPNHTSDESEWFKLSEQGVHPYKDYYIWKDAKLTSDNRSTYPNNWRSVFGGSVWTWNEPRKQYYMHQFSPEQVDLDFRNPFVQQEMESVLKYWLDMGVDGFRVDAVRHIYEAAHFKDEPWIREAKGDETDFVTLDHIYMISQPENADLIKSWRVLLDEYAKKDGRTRITCTEDYDEPYLIKNHLGNETHPGAQVAFYMKMTWMDYETNADSLDEMIRNMTEVFPARFYNWVLDNHDNKRVSSRYSPESVEAWSMLTLLLPGVASVYFGTELGMQDIKPRRDQRRDPQNAGNGRSGTRDGARAPMLWDDTRNAGFTTARKPWLPVNPNYWRTNVEAQKKDPNSHLHIFKRLVSLRNTPVIQYGDLQTYVPKEWVYMFTRSHRNKTIAVLMNLGSELEDVCIKHSALQLPDTMSVHTSSMSSGLKYGDTVKTTSSNETECIRMRPYSGLVLTTDRNHAARMTYSVILMFSFIYYFQSLI